MFDDAVSWVISTWDRSVQFVELNPGPFYAALLVISAVLFTVTISVFASELRHMRARQRQLGERVDALSALMDRTIAGLEKLTEAASTNQRLPVPEIAKRDEPQASASIRKELESLQLALRPKKETPPGEPG